MSVVYVPYKEIDKNKWDACISQSLNGLIYARSFYLDSMAANWDGLVLNDYEAIMPLTWKKKLQINYLYQPAFIQQGGVFSKTPVTQNMISLFVEKAFSHFKFAEMTFNYGNTNIPPGNDVQWSLRTNYILDLNKPYEALYENYDPGFTKSLRRIKKFHIEYEESADFTSIIQLYKKLYGKRLPYFSAKDFTNFENTCSKLSKENNVITRLAYSSDRKLLAAVILLKDEKRLYNIISCINPEGKKLEANYYLYDKIIAEFANTNLLFDLEGSDVKGIAGFYKKFNPVSQPYLFARYNHLHPLVKMFKR